MIRWQESELIEVTYFSQQRVLVEIRRGDRNGIPKLQLRFAHFQL